MLEFANSLTETFSKMGNSATIVMVLIVVTLVLTLSYFALRHLNGEVDQDNGQRPR
jgi:hypothetical protein